MTNGNFFQTSGAKKRAAPFGYLSVSLTRLPSPLAPLPEGEGDEVSLREFR
jgi:hypothetical protein